MIEVITEDRPPLLRFEEGFVKNVDETIKRGRLAGTNILKVYVRAHGDNKAEVPYIAEKYGEDGKVYETPWVTQLRERKHHKAISEEYYNYCVRALEQFKNSRTVPLNGLPITEWPTITKFESDRLRAINILTVEACSEMTEDTMQAFGIGARALKDKAALYLQNISEPAKSSEEMSAMKSALESANARAESQAQVLAEMQAQLNEMKNKKPGRPKKEEA